MPHTQDQGHGQGHQSQPESETDLVFTRFFFGLLVLLALYGAAMTIVLLFGPESLGVRMLYGFSSMFTGIIGLGSGYLLGHRS